MGRREDRGWACGNAKSRVLQVLSHPLRTRNAQRAADGANRVLLDLGMTRHRNALRKCGIDPNVMLAPMAEEQASVHAQVLLQITTIHATPRLRFANCLASPARARVSSRSASRAFMNASWTVSASVTKPGSIGDVTVNPPSSASSRSRISRPSVTV